MMNNNTLKAIELLRRLVETPSVSRQEDKAADLMAQAMTSCGFEPVRMKNNVWTSAPGFSPHRPTLLLNAHLDTVKPVASWSRNPYECALEGDRLYGLGSNDCGGGLVSLWQTFTVLAQRPQPYNLLFLASAEEFAHMNFGGLLRLSSRYSSVTWISIRPSSSRVKAS